MSEDSDAKAVEIAEQAYAAATAEAPVAAPLPVVEKATAPLEAVAVEPAKVPEAKPAPKTMPAAKAKPAPKAAKRKAAPAPAKPAKRKYVRKSVPPAGAKIAQAKPQRAKPQPTVKELKEKIMATAKKTKPEYSKLFQTAQVKAKEAYAKGASVAAEVGAFSKGNVEAVVASGKILGEGVKALGKDYVAESKGAFDTLTGDLKALAAVKSPTELFQLQGKLARRNFDNAVAYGSKTSESLVKLANEVFAPISNRVSLAVDKVSKAA